MSPWPPSSPTTASAISRQDLVALMFIPVAFLPKKPPAGRRKPPPQPATNSDTEVNR
ncbi:hypothetical protein [Mycobacterium shottsii]|uniref:hypothetical protein n=1 Tax=Mycobacterium shottsii TaxID=133549 RepID=UPI0018E93E1D|nr:hypothetical protein [Mycobacterium shottsii]